MRGEGSERGGEVTVTQQQSGAKPGRASGVPAPVFRHQTFRALFVGGQKGLAEGIRRSFLVSRPQSKPGGDVAGERG